MCYIFFLGKSPCSKTGISIFEKKKFLNKVTENLSIVSLTDEQAKKLVKENLQLALFS